MNKEKQTNDKKTFLEINNSDGFYVECKNLIEDTSAMIFSGYENVNLKNQDKTLSIDISRIKENKTTIKVILRYFEYVIIATMSFSYLKPIMVSGFTINDIYDMIKHHIRNRLIREIGSSETIIEMHTEYYMKIQY